MHNLDLFPPSARYVYLRAEGEPDLENYLGLHPQEQSLASDSVDKRKSEFGDARWCAHQALRELGSDTGAPILKGERGMPLWPAGFTGSLTHTEGFRAAVVAPTGLVTSIGLDVEPAQPLPHGILDHVAVGGECQRVERMTEDGSDYAGRLLFCAKEATYKCWFPLTRRWLGFDEAEIDIRPDGTFISHIKARPTPVPFFEGRWVVSDGFVFASTFI